MLNILNYYFKKIIKCLFIINYLFFTLVYGQVYPTGIVFSGDITDNIHFIHNHHHISSPSFISHQKKQQLLTVLLQKYRLYLELLKPRYTTTARATTTTTTPPPPTTTTTTPPPTTTTTTTTPAPPTTTPQNTCRCYAVTDCQALIDGNGLINFRIVTPTQFTCPPGTLFCCPNGIWGNGTAPPVPTPGTTVTPPTSVQTVPPRTEPPVTQTIPTAPPTTARPPLLCGVRRQIPPNQIPPTTQPGQAPYGYYPWNAAILTSNDVYVGGGVLIYERYVLTAAHKIANFATYTGLKVRLGDWNAVSNTEPYPFQDYGVLSALIHPNFNRYNLHYDIAIIRLNRDVNFTSPVVGTACLPNNRDSIYVGNRCWVPGWGLNAFLNGSYQPILKHVDVPVVSLSACQNALRTTKLGPNFVLSQTFVCAGGELNKDSCVGDGGSGLVCQNSNTGQWTVIGLVAWGIGCADRNIPGVYVNVGIFIDWVQDQVEYFEDYY